METMTFALCALVTAVTVSSSAVDDPARHRSSSKQDDKATRYCTDYGPDGCDMNIPSSTPNPSTEAESDNVELDTVPDSSAQQWDVLSTIGDILTSVKDTVLYNVYTKPLEYVYDQATEFAETVRSVFREELYNFLEYLWERGVGTDSQPCKS